MLAIGNHCEFCGTRDFLPFTCPKCNKSFCGAHREFHNCQSASPPPQTKPQRPASKASPPRTARPAPKPAKPVPAKPAPAKPAPTEAAKPAPTEAAKQSALERLRGLIGGKNAPSSRTTPVSPKTEPDLKKTAVGDPKIPEARRVYLRVTRPASTYKDALTNTNQKRPAKTVAVFYDRDASVGRVIDLAGVTLGVTGEKLESGSVPLDPNDSISSYASKNLLLM